MKKSQIKERVKYLDLLKCLGMFIVVQGHIHTNYGWFSLPLHCYVIPLYFFLSGLTFRRSKFPIFKDFAIHRLKSLMLPYAMFSVVTWAVWAAFNYLTHTEVDYWSPLLQTILAQGSGGYLVHNVPLWFVPCLFIIEMLYYWIDHLKKQTHILVVLILCACMGAWMIEGPYSSIFHLLPWSAEGAFVGILFYGLANLLVKNVSLKEIETKVVSHIPISIVTIVILTVVVIFSAYWNGHISIGSDLLGKSPLLFYINAWMGIITITLFSIIVSSIKSSSVLFNKIMDYHYWFGRNSFYIMSTHVPIKGILIVLFAGLIHRSASFIVNDYFWAAVVFAITCLLSSLAAMIVTIMKKHDEEMVKRIRMRWELSHSSK